MNAPAHGRTGTPRQPSEVVDQGCRRIRRDFWPCQGTTPVGNAGCGNTPIIGRMGAPGTGQVHNEIDRTTSRANAPQGLSPRRSVVQLQPAVWSPCLLYT